MGRKYNKKLKILWGLSRLSDTPHVIPQKKKQKGERTVFSLYLTYKIGMKVNDKQHGIDSQKGSRGTQLVGWLIAQYIKQEVCVCKYMFLYIKWNNVYGN